MSLRAAAGRRKKKKKATDRQWQNRIKEPSVVGEKKKTFRRLPATGSMSGPNQGTRGQVCGEEQDQVIG